MNQERILELQAEEIDSAYRDGALTEHEARQMQTEVNQRRKALYNQELTEEWGQLLDDTF